MRPTPSARHDKRVRSIRNTSGVSLPNSPAMRQVTSSTVRHGTAPQSPLLSVCVRFCPRPKIVGASPRPLVSATGYTRP